MKKNMKIWIAKEVTKESFREAKKQTTKVIVQQKTFLDKDNIKYVYKDDFDEKDRSNLQRLNFDYFLLSWQQFCTLFQL